MFSLSVLIGVKMLIGRKAFLKDILFSLNEHKHRFSSQHTCQAHGPSERVGSEVTQTQDQRRGAVLGLLLPDAAKVARQSRADLTGVQGTPMVFHMGLTPLYRPSDITSNGFHVSFTEVIFCSENDSKFSKGPRARF